MPQQLKNTIAAVFLAVWAGFFYSYQNNEATSCHYVYQTDHTYEYELAEEIEVYEDMEVDVEIAEQPTIYGSPLDDIAHSVPSPLEITTLMKESGLTYDLKNLHDYEHAPYYHSSHERAFNLGMYSTDLGYANLHEKNQDALHYLDAVNLLATGIQIERLVDYRTIKGLVKQKESNLQEILFTFTKNFEAANTQLSEEGRNDLRVLIASGAWLESMHIANQLHQYQTSDDLRDKIGEQKIIISEFIYMLRHYSDKHYHQELLEDFRALEMLYDDVEIETAYKEPVMIESDGELSFVDQSVTQITISEAQIDLIGQKIEEMRAKYIEAL